MAVRLDHRPVAELDEVPAEALAFCRRHGIEEDLRMAMDLAPRFFPTARDPIFYLMADYGDQWLSVRYSIGRSFDTDEHFTLEDLFADAWREAASELGQEMIIVHFDRV